MDRTPGSAPLAPRVSVIMAVYNGARYLQEAIESILSQTFVDFEFIIIDDGSTDPSLEIIKGYSDQRIVILENAVNRGLPYCLNLGIQNARGKYIARHDADDISHPDRLARQVQFLENNPQVGVVACKTQWIDRHGQHILFWEQPTTNPEIQETLLRYCCVIHGSTMSRLEAMRTVGRYNISMRTGQDYDLWLRIAEHYEIACVPEVLYQHRRHAEMVSVTRNQEQSQWAQQAVLEAVGRRIDAGFERLGLRKKRTLERWPMLERQEAATRFVWWSAGSRWISKSTALKLLVIAFLLDPLSPEIRRYASGILSRKMKKVKEPETL